MFTGKHYPYYYTKKMLTCQQFFKNILFFFAKYQLFPLILFEKDGKITILNIVAKGFSLCTIVLFYSGLNK